MSFVLGGGGVEEFGGVRIEEQQKLWWGFPPSVHNVFLLNSQGIFKTLVTSNGYCVKLPRCFCSSLKFM